MATGQYGLSRPYVGTFTCRECGRKFSRTSNQAACLIHKRKRDATAWYSPDTCGKCASYHGIKKAVAIKAKKIEEAKEAFHETAAELTFTDHFKLDVKNGPVMCFGDSHAPYHCEKTIGDMCEVAAFQGVKRAACIGDLIDMNFLVDKIHGGGAGGEQQHSGTQTFKLAERMVEGLLKVFDELYYIPGNHCLWISRVLEGRISFPQLARMFTPSKGGKIYTSEFAFADIGSWRHTHPLRGGYSKRVTTIARELAEIKQRPVCLYHQHGTGLEFTRSGKFPGIAVGMTCEPSKMRYLQITDSTHPKWHKEFVMVTPDDRLIRFYENKYLWPNPKDGMRERFF